MRILDVGSGKNSVAAQVFADVKDKEIVRMDADEALNPDILHDITQELPEHLLGQFDIVYVSHVMEHIDRIRVIQTLVYLSKALKNLGEMWVIVPSMEWGAQEILAGRDGLHIQGLIFGGQNTPWDYHRCGFTLSALRTLFDLIGLVVRKAYQSPFGIELGENVVNCVQNVVIGARYDGLGTQQTSEVDSGISGN
jgi:hypothetical protein